MVLFWKPKILNGFDGKSYVCAGGLPCKNIQYYYYIIIVIIIIVNIIIIIVIIVIITIITNRRSFQLNHCPNVVDKSSIFSIIGDCRLHCCVQYCTLLNESRLNEYSTWKGKQQIIWFVFLQAFLSLLGPRTLFLHAPCGCCRPQFKSRRQSFQYVDILLLIFFIQRRLPKHLPVQWNWIKIIKRTMMTSTHQDLASSLQFWTRN